MIDKHDLHSVWPVYTQPETRVITQEGVKLSVTRTQSCFGPGDTISVLATLHSDSMHTIVLRGFELGLKEVTTFTVGRKPPAPQVNNRVVDESKVAVNQALHGGTQAQSELVCRLPHNHAITTVTSARHIDITYSLVVKAVMGTGTHIAMELPIIISNWTRWV